MFECFPTNWGLPRATLIESQCAATGAPACVWNLRWRNPPIGARVWGPAAAGAALGGVLALATMGEPWVVRAAMATLPLVAGAAGGVAWRERRQRHEIERLRDIQSEEILHSAQELDKKFRDLETKIEQLSLLIDLSAAVNATLDTEKIYDQALDRLVHRMGFQAANLFLVDPARAVVRAHRSVGDEPHAALEAIEFRLDADDSLTARVARTGLPVIVNDVEHHRPPRASADGARAQRALAGRGAPAGEHRVLRRARRGGQRARVASPTPTWTSSPRWPTTSPWPSTAPRTSRPSRI